MSLTHIDVSSHFISNGMKVLLIPSTRAPVVALQGWIRYGAADESDDIAGIAHLFEHLLFKGTKKRAVGQIAAEIEGLGGDLNAYTTYDHTVMHMTLASKHMNQGLDILADALMNSVVDEGELSNERPVILEEIKRRNDMPGAIAGDLFRSALFAGHPYSRPVIGYDHIVANMSREKLMHEYHSHYNTSNVFIVICGDFKKEEALLLCEKHFSDMRKGQSPGQRSKLKTLDSQRSFFKNHNSPDALIHIGWRAPNAVHKDVAALDALALILGQGDSSRLVKKLVHEKALVRAIGASYWSPKDTGSFSVSFKAASGVAKNFKQIQECIAECLKQPVTAQELQKAKKNLLSSAIYSRETVDGLADRYSYYESICQDWKQDAAYLETVQSLTTQDLENARDQYLKWEDSLAGGIVPEKDILPEYKAEQPKVSSPSPSRTPKAAQSPKNSHGVEKFEHNGLKVLVKTVRDLPVFSMRWVGWGGQRLESSTEQGIGSLWSRTVCESGTGIDGKIWTRDELNETLDSMSASLSAFHGKNSFGFQSDGLSEDFEKLFDLLLVPLLKPSFEESIIKQSKDHLQQDWKSQNDNPSYRVGKLFSEKLFSKHAYGRGSLSDPKLLKQFQKKTLLNYHKKLLQQPQTLCIVGNIESHEVLSLLKNRLAAHKTAKKSSLSQVKKLSFKPGKHELSEKMKKEQTHILYGFPTCDFKNKDRWALVGLASVLSGQGGRLFIELRDKLSLCYSVAPTHLEGIDAGYFAFYMGTSPEKKVTAIEGMKKELRRIIKEGVPQSEWEKALNFVTGNHELSQQSLSAQAMGMALDELYGLGYEEYYNFAQNLAQVKPADLQRVTKKYLDPDKAKTQILATVGPG